MRAAAFGLCLVTLAWGQPSTPAHWRFAPAEPAVLIGVDWRQVSRPIPDGLDFVQELTGLLVAADPAAAEPRFLATATGRFNLTKLRMMAAAEGARTGRYRGVEFFSADGVDLAVIDARTVLVGDAGSVRAGINRGATATPRESARWRRAAELSVMYPAWIAAPSHDGGIALNQLTFDKLKLATTAETALLETGLKPLPAGGPLPRPSLTDQVVPEAPPAPPPRRVVRIIGLEEGTREIPFPARDN